MVIGLTGKFCSGKSTADLIIQRLLECSSIDVDRLGHSALEKCKIEIIESFGASVLDESGSINRKNLGAIVFNNPLMLNKLNKIVHPPMCKEVEEIIKDNKDRDIIINAALLFEMELDKLCDYIIIIKSSLLITFLRGIKRDNRTIKQIWNILKKQNNKEYSKKKLKNDDIIIIENNGSINKLESKLKKTLLKKGVIYV